MDFQHELAWAVRNMPLTARAAAKLPNLNGQRVACSMHLDVKVATALAALLEHGAELFLLTCNASTVRDQAVAHLVERGARAHAWLGMSEAERETGLDDCRAWSPTLLNEMGGDLSHNFARDGQPGSVLAGLEATGSGIARHAGLTLPYPVFNWDDLPVKEGLHNRHMVGLSTWVTFMERTRLSLHGKRVLVVGYGLVGQGLADKARAFGGTVRVAELDAARALEAMYLGFPVNALDAQALAWADVIVTATGRPGVIGRHEIEAMRDNVILMNVGHEPNEIDLEVLGQRREIIPFLEEARPFGRSVLLFAGGSMANLSAGHGDSLNAFDLTLAVMLAGIGFIAQLPPGSLPGLQPLPRHVWTEVASWAAWA